jgi:hypothetical protein
MPVIPAIAGSIKKDDSVPGLPSQKMRFYFKNNHSENGWVYGSSGRASAQQYEALSSPLPPKEILIINWFYLLQISLSNVSSFLSTLFIFFFTNEILILYVTKFTKSYFPYGFWFGYPVYNHCLPFLHQDLAMFSSFRFIVVFKIFKYSVFHIYILNERTQTPLLSIKCLLSLIFSLLPWQASCLRGHICCKYMITFLSFLPLYFMDFESVLI